MSDSEENTRNPSPPPNLENGNVERVEDNIGSTTFSQRFVLKCLVDLTHIEQNDEDKEDIDPEFEDDLSKLWDMTVDHEVSEFLVENDVIDVFHYAISKTTSPRLCEILVGILANMVCSQKPRSKLLESTKFVTTILSTLSFRDIPSLRESYRLLVTLSNYSTLDDNFWQCFKDKDCIQDVKFIFESCQNVDVLRLAFEFVDNLMDEYNDHINVDDIKSSAVIGLEEIVEHKDFEAMAPATHLIQAFSHIPPEYTKRVTTCLKKCIRLLKECDHLKSHHFCTIASVCSALKSHSVEISEHNGVAKIPAIGDEGLIGDLCEVSARIRRESEERGEEDSHYLSAAREQCQSLINALQTHSHPSS